MSELRRLLTLSAFALVATLAMADVPYGYLPTSAVATDQSLLSTFNANGYVGTVKTSVYTVRDHPEDYILRYTMYNDQASDTIRNVVLQGLGDWAPNLWTLSQSPIGTPYGSEPAHMTWARTDVKPDGNVNMVFSYESDQMPYNLFFPGAGSDVFVYYADAPALAKRRGFVWDGAQQAAGFDFYAPVPEPSLMIFAGIGAGAAALAKRRKLSRSR